MTTNKSIRRYLHVAEKEPVTLPGKLLSLSNHLTSCVFARWSRNNQTGIPGAASLIPGVHSTLGSTGGLYLMFHPQKNYSYAN